MFENSGKKIKLIVKVLFWINWLFILAVWCITCSCAIKMVGDAKKICILIGLAEVIVLPLLSWIVSLIFYGYGELIDKTIEIANRMEEK